jgi:hypothetical protein
MAISWRVSIPRAYADTQTFIYQAKGLAMSVMVLLPDPMKKPVPDTFSDATDSTAYRVLDSGVLQVLKQIERRWYIWREFSPIGWIHVEGTRYLSDTGKLDGFMAAP